VRTLLNLRNGEVKVCQRTAGDFAVVRNAQPAPHIAKVFTVYAHAYTYALTITRTLHTTELMENDNG
jgi:hypothetical protein